MSEAQLRGSAAEGRAEAEKLTAAAEEAARRLTLTLTLALTLP